MTKRWKGKQVSRGYGFINFKTEDGLRKALGAQGPIELDGFRLIVAEARPRPVRVRDTLYIQGIPEGTTKEDLMKAFEAHHPKEALVVRCNSDKGRGFGFIQFATEQDQTNAMQAGREIDFKGGKSIVRFAKRSLSARRPGSRSRRAPRASPVRSSDISDMSDNSDISDVSDNSDISDVSDNSDSFEIEDVQ